jgi:hypothetical protein
LVRLRFFRKLKKSKVRQPSLFATLRAKAGGGKGNRTPDLLNAIQALYQLSYTPKKNGASKQTRTVDLLITNQLLYQLSYAGSKTEGIKLFFWAKVK